MSFRLIVSGDTILNHRASTVTAPGFLAAVELLRSADVMHTQLETPIAEPGRPGVVPSAEGGMSWYATPAATVEELRWLGAGIVSTAGNHALDYSYGGLASTWAALDAGGLPHAGTGPDLAAARRPAFLETAHGRIGLVSAASSIPTFARAGAVGHGLPGRPGVNALRFVHVVDEETADAVVALHTRMGDWVTRDGDQVTINPPGLHNSTLRFRVGDGDMTTEPDRDDLDGNRASVAAAAHQADFVIAHLHAHEWNGLDGRVCTTAAFVEKYARAMVEAGANVVIVQGSHAPMRGIEIHRGRPIFYDPGDLVKVGRPDRQPADYYLRPGFGHESRRPDATIADAYAASARMFGAGSAAFRVSPTEGYSREPGFFVPVCTVGERMEVESVELHPMRWMTGTRQAAGLPSAVTGDAARAVLEHAAALSEPYGTRIAIQAGTGHIRL